MDEKNLTHCSPEEWEKRLAVAALLSAQGLECPICGGTGGWPGLHAFVNCRPCNGLGMNRETRS